MIIYFDIETVTDTENIKNFDMQKLRNKYGEKINFSPEFTESKIPSSTYSSINGSRSEG